MHNPIMLILLINWNFIHTDHFHFRCHLKFRYNIWITNNFYHQHYLTLIKYLLLFGMHDSEPSGSYGIYNLSGNLVLIYRVVIMLIYFNYSTWDNFYLQKWIINLFLFFKLISKFKLFVHINKLRSISIKRIISSFSEL